MTTTWPTDAAIRDQARGIAPELTTVLGVADSAVSAGTATRVQWCRDLAGATPLGTAAAHLTCLGYLLAHRTTRDLAGSQGVTTAPIGGGATAGAMTQATTGGMSVGFGAGGVYGPAPTGTAAWAELTSTQYGQAALGLMQTRVAPTMPRAL